MMWLHQHRKHSGLESCTCFPQSALQLGTSLEELWGSAMDGECPSLYRYGGPAVTGHVMKTAFVKQLYLSSTDAHTKISVRYATTIP